jgi:hypothetical protein
LIDFTVGIGFLFFISITPAGGGGLLADFIVDCCWRTTGLTLFDRLPTTTRIVPFLLLSASAVGFLFIGGFVINFGGGDVTGLLVLFLLMESWTSFTISNEAPAVNGRALTVLLDLFIDGCVFPGMSSFSNLIGSSAVLLLDGNGPITAGS